MTSKEYLMQGYRLEHRIKLHQEEIERLRELACSCGSPSLEEHYNPNPNTRSPFESILLTVFDMEKEHAAMLEQLLALKNQIIETINTVENVDERLVLRYRYICNNTWSAIGDKLCFDERTIRRWHDRALTHVTLPANPIWVENYF